MSINSIEKYEQRSYFNFMVKYICIFACIFSMCVKPPAHVAISDKSVHTFAKSILNKEMKVLAVGGFYLEKKVENLYLDLEYLGYLPKEKAQSILVETIDGLLLHINNDVELLPYLIKDRFSTDDISVSLSYLSKEGDPLQVHLYNGEIIFSRYNLQDNSLEKIESIGK